MKINELTNPPELKQFKTKYSSPAISKNIQKFAARNTPKWVKFLIMNMDKRGFKLVGKGIHGAVFKHPNYQWVIKVYRNDRAYEEWIDLSTSNPTNKFMPKVKGSPKRLNDNFSYVRLETLNPPNVQEANKLVDQIDDVASYYWSKKTEYDEKYDPDLIQIGKIMRDYEAWNDLSAHNIMQRPNGQLVVVDPFYEYGELE